MTNKKISRSLVKQPTTGFQYSQSLIWAMDIVVFLRSHWDRPKQRTQSTMRRSSLECACKNKRKNTQTLKESSVSVKRNSVEPKKKTSKCIKWWYSRSRSLRSIPRRWAQLCNNLKLKTQNLDNSNRPQSSYAPR
jgi:hypothetical protein